MSLLVVGSVAFDTIETPHGKRERIAGGSCVHFSYSAAYLTPVKMIGVVGKDYPKEFIDLLNERGIDTSGIEHTDGETFFWSGKYEGDMNEAETLETRLNVFGDFRPKVEGEDKDAKFVFLANGHPLTQLSLLEQLNNPTLVIADTMDLWIREFRPDLEKLLNKIDALVLNDGEARLLTGERSMIRAARKLLAAHELKLIIIKKGEHGSLAVTPDFVIATPAYPTEAVIDPTGAGDSFAGGTLGYLSLCGELNQGTLRRAIRYGTVCASFQVEDFSLDRHKGLTRADIERRLIDFEHML